MNDPEASTTVVGRTRTEGTVFEVLWVATKQGLTSFGGPIAHLGYFHDEYVRRRKWVDEQSYADLVALCQFAPGPTSSKVGFSLGLLRAGYLGGLAAWAGFTLPSALALLLFAYGAAALSGPVGTGLLHGLKLVAVAIVAQAVWGMARTLCPDRARLDRRRGSAHRAAQHVRVLPAGRHPVRGGDRCVALPSGWASPCGARAHQGVTPSGRGRAGGVLRTSLRSPAAARPHRIPSDRHDGGVLSFGCARVRRRARGPAAVARSGGRARVGGRRRFPGRLRGGAGRAGSALHLRDLPGRGDGTGAARCSRRGPRPGGHLPPPGSCCTSGPCRSGRASVGVQAPRPSCEGSTPVSWDCWERRSTSRSGPLRFEHRTTSPWRWSASSCSWRGRRHRSSSSP